MALLPNNLTTHQISDADLTARCPVVARYRPSANANFHSEIQKGTEDALAEFHAYTGFDPIRCAAVRPEAWQRILELCTLRMIFAANTDERAETLADRYTRERDDALRRFQYRYDEDESGTLTDDIVEEEDRKAGEVRIVR